MRTYIYRIWLYPLAPLPSHFANFKVLYTCVHNAHQLVMVMYNMVVTPDVQTEWVCYLKSHLSYRSFWAHHTGIVACHSTLMMLAAGYHISHPSYSGMTSYISNALVDFLFSTERLLLVARCMGDCSRTWVHTIKSVVQLGHVHFVYIVWTHAVSEHFLAFPCEIILRTTPFKRDLCSNVSHMEMLHNTNGHRMMPV